jgi:CheY-like chemotaxis protein
MRVGLVEDQAEIVEVMTLLLKLEGHEVVAHKSGEVLLEALAAGEIYDVLLLDLGLPDGMSGQDLVRVLRHNVRTARLPLLIVTAAEEREIAEVLRTTPGLAVLRKRFTRARLLQQVHSLTVGLP